VVHPETPFHILWTCPSSVEMWQESARKIQKLSLVEDGSLGFIQALKNKLDEKSFGEALITMRLIWLCRNSFVFDRGWESPDQVLKKAKRVMEELEDSGPRTAEAGVQGTSASPFFPQWIRPSIGFLKLNWDAALNQELRRVGIGVVAQNDRGEVVAAIAKSMPFRTDPAMAEAFAAWEAVNFCFDRGWKNIIFEGDALSIVLALRNTGQCWSAYGHVIEDTKVLLERVESVAIKHVNRSGNKVAHSLSQMAIS
jgi:ribonuclease HI